MRQASVDALAKDSLGDLAQEPFERLERYVCGGLSKPKVNGVYSNDGQENRCQISPPENYTDQLGMLAVGHSHPKFKWPRDEGLKCGPFTIFAEFIIDTIEVITGDSFSGPDMGYAEYHNVPLYLAVPYRTHVEVYRKDATGNWDVEKL